MTKVVASSNLKERGFVSRSTVENQNVTGLFFRFPTAKPLRSQTRVPCLSTRLDPAKTINLMRSRFSSTPQKPERAGGASLSGFDLKQFRVLKN
jgi:hypothetical protein